MISIILMITSSVTPPKGVIHNGPPSLHFVWVNVWQLACSFRLQPQRVRGLAEALEALLVLGYWQWVFWGGEQHEEFEGR